MPTDDKWFTDMPDCYDKDYDSLLLANMIGNKEIGENAVAHFNAKMMIGITRMKNEIKRLKMNPVDNLSRN